jgi:hypothetical protein
MERALNPLMTVAAIPSWSAARPSKYPRRLWLEIRTLERVAQPKMPADNPTIAGAITQYPNAQACTTIAIEATSASSAITNAMTESGLVFPLIWGLLIRNSNGEGLRYVGWLAIVVG